MATKEIKVREGQRVGTHGDLMALEVSGRDDFELRTNRVRARALEPSQTGTMADWGGDKHTDDFSDYPGEVEH